MLPSLSAKVLRISKNFPPPSASKDLRIWKKNPLPSALKVLRIWKNSVAFGGNSTYNIKEIFRSLRQQKSLEYIGVNSLANFGLIEIHVTFFVQCFRPLQKNCAVARKLVENCSWKTCEFSIFCKNQKKRTEKYHTFCFKLWVFIAVN